MKLSQEMEESVYWVCIGSPSSFTYGMEGQEA